MASPSNIGIPYGPAHFDDSHIFEIIPEDGELTRSNQVHLAEGTTLTLAEFQLRPEHTGTLLYFAQFTDLYAVDNRHVDTPGYRWALLCDEEPLSPWLTFDLIVNPWGMPGPPLSLHLRTGCKLRFVIENVDVASTDKARWLCKVGGRIAGHYWFEEEHRGPLPLQTYEPWRIPTIGGKR